MAEQEARPPELTPDLIRAYAVDPVRFLHEQYICRSAVTGKVGLVRLEPWQEAIVRGALCADPATRLRRHNLAVIGLGKKNGKSELGAMLACWFAICDEPRGEIIIAANDKEQATSITFRRLSQAIARNPSLARGATLTKHRILLASGTEVRAVPCDPEGEAGNQATLTVFDELWGQRSPAFYHELTLNPVRRQPMTVVTTCAGYDRGHFLHDLYEQGRLGADPQMYFHWREGRAAANPASWVTEAYLRQQEQRLPPPVFRRLHCNEWAGDSCTEAAHRMMAGLWEDNPATTYFPT